MESHPMWVRGLKLGILQGSIERIKVAPYVGAWIETGLMYKDGRQKDVAPYVGAWIETD